MAAGSTDDQPAASSTNEATDETETGRAAIWAALTRAKYLTLEAWHSVQNSMYRVLHVWVSHDLQLVYNSNKE